MNNRIAVKIIDTTLREGEQTPGVLFDLEIKQGIAAGLAGLGVDEVELGVSSRENSDLASLVAFFKSNYPHRQCSLWSRCVPEDIHYGATLGVQCLSLSIPVSDLHLTKKMGKNKEWAIEKVKECVEQALAEGVEKVAVGLEDASRSDSNFIREVAEIAEEAGAFRLRLADTVGVCTPSDIVVMLESLSGVDMELAVHCHNDFGMATANTITALDNGAAWGDATLLGLGERAGNSRLEEILAFLVLRKGAGKYDLSGLPALSRMVAEECGVAIPGARPIIGSALFTCETGLHVHGIMADPSTYEPFDPEVFGASRKLLVGAQAGRRSVLATLVRLGLPTPDKPGLTRLTRKVRSLAALRKRSLADHEIKDLVGY